MMLALMLNIVQFSWWTVKRDKTPKSHCARYTPVYIIMFSAVLIMVQPVSMLVIGSWASVNNFFFDGADFNAPCLANADCGSNMCLSDAYSCVGTKYGKVQLNAVCTQLMAGDDGVNCTDAEVTCACGMDSNALIPNTTVGWLIQVLCTYLGFIIMFTGVFMATKLHKKIARKWRVLRSAASRPRKKKEYPRAQPAPVTVNGAPAAPADGDCTTGD